MADAKTPLITLPTDTEEIDCPICGGKKRTWRCDEKGWKIWTCAQCGHTYVSPRPTEDFLKRYYESCYLSSSQDAGQQWEGKLGGIFESVIQSVDRYHPGRGDFLEVGAGFGGLLELADRNGWRVSGIEPSESGVATIRQRLGDRAAVYQGLFEEFDLPPNSFDCLAILNVIEHVRDPLSVCRKAFDLLRPNGCIVIRWPQMLFLNLMRKKMGAPEPELLGAPAHLHDFCDKSVRRMLAEAGFKDVRHCWSSTRDVFSSSRGVKRMLFRATKTLAYLTHVLSGGRLITPFVARLTLARKP